MDRLLLVAAKNGDSEIIMMLLKSSADIECRDSDGNTPLMLASMNERLECVRLLASLGANIDACNKKGMSPLMVAIYKMKKEVVEELVRLGADVECRVRDKGFLSNVQNSGVKNLISYSHSNDDACGESMVSVRDYAVTCMPEIVTWIDGLIMAKNDRKALESVGKRPLVPVRNDKVKL